MAGTVHPQLWLDPEEDPRNQDPLLADERTTLLDYLHNYRLTLELKCGGLDAEELARRSVPPSNLSLLGLVRHLAAVEHSWFVRVMQGQDVPRHFRSTEDRDEDFNGAAADDDLVAEAFSLWKAEMAAADAWLAATASLDTLSLSPEVTINLREVLVHLIEEYARHCGHADLLRECIDGATGA